MLPAVNLKLHFESTFLAALHINFGFFWRKKCSFKFDMCAGGDRFSFQNSGAWKSKSYATISQMSLSGRRRSVLVCVADLYLQ